MLDEWNRMTKDMVNADNILYIVLRSCMIVEYVQEKVPHDCKTPSINSTNK